MKKNKFGDVRVVEFEFPKLILINYKTEIKKEQRNKNGKQHRKT